ncbi:MAG: hypothetical protein PF694_00885 [Bacteroidetes bacterium]|jgi:hypothetical protein|nr:hypothetical protein [Bacteroidota bacterium]
MKLILFTNLRKMPYIREKLEGFGTNEQNIAFVHQNNTSLYNEGNNNLPENLEVILVNDNIDVSNEVKDTILGLIKNDADIFVVFHNNTRYRKNQADVFNGINYQQTSDSHLAGSIYHEIDNWASDGCQSDKLIPIIKKHFADTKLEAVLEFLHQCLNDEMKDDYLQILSDAKIDIGDGEGSIRNLFGKVKEAHGDKKNPDLADLRDALFETLRNPS